MIKIKDWFKKNWWIVFLCVLAIMITSSIRKGILSLFGIGKSQQAKDDEIKITKKIAEKYKISDDKIEKYKTRALSIAKNMGTFYEWYDPYNWLENDNALYYDLVSLKEYDYHAVSECYAQLFSTKENGKERNLLVDVKQYLNSSLLTKLKTQVSWIS